MLTSTPPQTLPNRSGTPRVVPAARTTAPPTSQPPVLTVDGLTKRYGSHAAVDDLSFEVPAGSVIGLLGPNGAGKTTAMKMLLGLVRPSDGSVNLLGAEYGSSDYPHALRRVGALIEAPALYERLSARKNLVLQSHALGIPAEAARIDSLLELVDLSERADDPSGTFSLGMKQRLGIAVGLISEPAFLVLDEPANGLDPAGIVEIRNLLRRLPSMGTTVLVSSHQLAEVQQACDSLVVMDRGRIVTVGSTDEILASHNQGNAHTRFAIRVDTTETDRAVATLARQSLNPTVDSEWIWIDAPDQLAGRDLNQLLAAEGVFAHELTAHTPSLEDAFLAMTHGEMSQ
jgi:ABC-2 type transport system ATP-binding protein